MLAQMALALDWYSDLEMVVADGFLFVQAARASRAMTTEVSRRITAG